MLEIVTTTGVSLDMEKDLDIQVELEQPLLDADHLPVAYSTQISFPFTETNKTAFGFVPAMMLEPSVKQLDARILFYGRELFSGSLVYDGVEDGKLKYIFTEKGLEEALEADIAPAEEDTVTYDQLMTEGNKYRMPVIVDGRYSSFYVPPLDGSPGDSYDYTEKDIKYRNFARNLNKGEVWGEVDENLDYDHSCPLLPSVKLLSLLAFLDTSPMMEMGPSLLDCLYLILPYGETERMESYPPVKTGIGAKSGQHRGKVKPENYPEASYAQILKSICAMMCAAVFKFSGRYVLYPAGRIFSREENNANVLFWDGKVSDIYSLGIETAKNYSLTLGSDTVDGELSDTSGKVTDSYELLKRDHPDTHERVVELLSSYDVANMRKIFSLRSHIGTRWENPNFDCRLYDIKVVYRNGGRAEHNAESEESFDVSCDFKPVVSAPERIIVHGSSGNLAVYDFRAPHIEMPAAEDGRGKDLIVGIMVEQEQSEDYIWRVGTPLPSLVEQTNDNAFSLLPGELYAYYHRQLAEWMGTDRTVVKTDLDLTVDDLTELALYKRVNFRGRDWMIKRLSLTFHTDGGHFEATGEFISL